VRTSPLRPKSGPARSSADIAANFSAFTGLVRSESWVATS
jgi:hypothetical protein